MLDALIIDRLVRRIMDEFPLEHDGKHGWTQEGLRTAVFEADGDDEDLLDAMALGMNLCGVPGHRLK